MKFTKPQRLFFKLMGLFKFRRFKMQVNNRDLIDNSFYTQLCFMS